MTETCCYFAILEQWRKNFYSQKKFKWIIPSWIVIQRVLKRKYKSHCTLAVTGAEFIPELKGLGQNL